MDYYDVSQSAKILGRSKSTIRKYLNSGELEGEYEDGFWKVTQASVHERKEALERGTREIPSQSAEDALQAIERLSVALGRERGRKELSDASEDNLIAERDRLRQALDDERERRIRAEVALSYARLPWWKKLWE